jgi:hypothetical protein
VIAGYKDARAGLLEKGLFVEGADLTSLEDRMLLARTAAFYILVNRIAGWKGVVGRNGEETVCTKENKVKYFGRRPQDVETVLSEVGRQEEEEIKNSETSQDG